MDNLIQQTIWDNFNTHVDEEDGTLLETLIIGMGALRQIEQTIETLKEANIYQNDGEREVKWRAASALHAIKQLEAFLESLTITQKESTEESNNTA